MNRLVLHRSLWLVPLALWGVLTGTSLLWNCGQLDRHSAEIAANRARFVFKMVESVRLWNARHGGIYVAVDADTEPNPYLEMDERDIVTPTGRALTLMNPAYMTRQITYVVMELADIAVHLTSLKPINPANGADPWERRALEAFEHGSVEETQFVTEGDTTLYRFMAPLVTQRACLKCHEKQGYRVGDIRGGVSVTFKAAPLLAPQTEQKWTMAAIHAMVWLLLSAVTLLALRGVRSRVLQLAAAKEQQDRLVELRTAELRSEVAERHQAEAQLRLFIESSGEGIYGVDRAGNCTLVNPEAVRLLGYASAGELLGRPMHGLIQHSRADGRPLPLEECRPAATYLRGEPVHADDDVFWRADGRSFPVEYRSHPLHSEDALIGAVVTFSDITERKRTEAELKKLSSALEHSPAVAIITDYDGRIEYVNPRFSEVTGFTAEEVLGKNPRLWQSGKTSLKTYQRLWATLKSGHVWHGEVMNRKKDGRFYWEDAHISPIRDGQGNITHFVAIKEDITIRKEQEEQIWRQAHYDGLTDLPNRDLFRVRLEQALVRSEHNGRHAALLYLDLDGFKQVNDTMGHDAGDELLRQAAVRITGALRDSDTAARLGGDEFAVILGQVNGPDGAAAAARKLLATLAQCFTVREMPVNVSGSIGIALYPGDGETGDQLLRNADMAMYRAKQTGRNRYCFFTRGEE